MRFGGSPDDGIPAKSAGLDLVAIELGRDGALYLIDGTRVRRVDGISGIITTVAGRGTWYGPLGDGGPATEATLSAPGDLSFGTQGNLFIDDSGHYRIRRVDANTRVISTVAGTGHTGVDGDGGPAVAASIGRPAGIVVYGGGSFAISGEHRIR